MLYLLKNQDNTVFLLRLLSPIIINNPKLVSSPQINNTFVATSRCRCLFFNSTGVDSPWIPRQILSSLQGICILDLCPRIVL